MRVDQRSLKGLIARASSARVLDLHAVAHENLENPGYFEHPLFIHPVLNRAIIAKHNAGPGEAQVAPRRFNATKIIFPFDKSDLGLGGQYVFVDQGDFIAALTRLLDYTDLTLDRDLAVLRAIDRLPTLDPFLIHEILSQQHINVDPCYCRLSRTDEADMLGFVAHEIRALILLCFGELKADDSRALRLSQLLLSEPDSAELAPLREAFRMDAAEFAEAMFSWKAFLYYRWRSVSVGPMLKTTLRSISAIHPRRYHIDEMAFVTRAKSLLEKTITASWRDAGRQLGRYDRAFATLTEEKNSDGFRVFLKDSQGLFFALGDRIGRLEQLASFWNDRFASDRIAGMPPDEVLDGLRDLLQALAVEVYDLDAFDTPNAPQAASR